MNTGSCVASAVACTTLPTIADADAGDCVAGATSGTVCTPVCKTGFTGTLSGKLLVFLINF